MALTHPSFSQYQTFLRMGFPNQWPLWSTYVGDTIFSPSIFSSYSFFGGFYLNLAYNKYMGASDDKQIKNMSGPSTLKGLRWKGKELLKEPDFGIHHWHTHIWYTFNAISWVFLAYFLRHLLREIFICWMFSSEAGRQDLLNFLCFCFPISNELVALVIARETPER